MNTTSIQKPVDVLLCMGTRPEIIKMMPVYKALASQQLNVQVLHTGQHHHIAHQLYEQFNIPIVRSLEPSREKKGLASLSASLMSQVSDAIETVCPKVVLVHGDTSSAMIGAICSFYLQIPVGHVEAGLRTGEFYSPFPEEKNRELISRLAHLHFCPTESAAMNLHREGISDSIVVTGNTVIDAAQWVQQSFTDGAIPRELETLVFNGAASIINQRFILVTAHRRENWGDGLIHICRALIQWLSENPDDHVIWPLHPNPDVIQTVHSTVMQYSFELRSRFHCIHAVQYDTLVWLLSKAWVVATDSGGIQEESTAFQKPVLILRDSTERPEIVDCGLGTLVGTSENNILAALSAVHTGQFPSPHRAITLPFGDGHASERIAQHLIQNFL